MDNIEQVIVLGAGASITDDAPSQADLFKKFFEYYRTNKDSVINSISKDQEKLLVHFFDKFWDIDIENNNNYQFPTFEECLGVLDLAYIRRESFKGLSRDEIKDTRNALIFLIGKILDETLKNKPTINNHKKLIDKLIDEKNLKKTAFISFNYDILIDNVLTPLLDTDDMLYLDYGFDFINEDWKKPDPNNSIILYKIHGSLNWLYCPTCNKMEWTYNQKEKVHKSICNTEPCSFKGCDMPLEPVIIPPTYYKDMNNIYIQEIFLKSEEILRNAKKIFFCGYSFPDADIHFKYILKRAELFNQNQPKIFIINRDPHIKINECTKEEKVKEENRISRIFKNKQNIRFTNLSFQDFVEKGTKCLK